MENFVVKDQFKLSITKYGYIQYIFMDIVQIQMVLIYIVGVKMWL